MFRLVSGRVTAVLTLNVDTTGFLFIVSDTPKAKKYRRKSDFSVTKIVHVSSLIAVQMTDSFIILRPATKKKLKVINGQIS